MVTEPRGAIKIVSLRLFERLSTASFRQALNESTACGIPTHSVFTGNWSIFSIRSALWSILHMPQNISDFSGFEYPAKTTTDRGEAWQKCTWSNVLLHLNFLPHKTGERRLYTFCYKHCVRKRILICFTLQMEGYRWYLRKILPLVTYREMCNWYHEDSEAKSRRVPSC